MFNPRIQILQDLLINLEKQPGLELGQEVVKAIVGLLVPDSENLKFRQFTDQGGKLTSNASWFQSDSVITDRLATYILDVPPESNLDIKLYALKDASMRTIAWSVGLTENFEDEPFNGRFNVGIDFLIPKTLDRVIVALSQNYIVRTIELKGKLTATFQEILNSWIQISDLSRKGEFHAILWNSFDLHPINKRFYEGISQRFINLRQHLENNEIHDSHHAAQFANRLIGRVIFTWFLDKKGLLNETSGYFESSDFGDDTTYYKERLEPLFFEVLNMPVTDRRVEDLFTPYLNGGLFESKPEDLYKSDLLTFPKNYFDDLLQFLRGYNFTTDESTSEFQQVAIDPEMLGRIFENLLAEVSEDTGAQARKAKGAFYTPREVVDYMCRESLKGYLKSRIAQDENLERRLYQLIDAPEREYHDQDHNWRRDLKPYKDEIVAALDDLKVIDPACGSGAFPIGMLQLLVKVYSRIEPRFDSHKAKLSIIDKNIFGADIEPMAVEISRLRTWLAIVVEQKEHKLDVKPLPNLDFKFVCANSLLSLDSSDTLSLFEEDQLEIKLQELREQYFRTQNLSKKKDLRAKYQLLVQEEMTLFGDTFRASQLKSFQPFESDRVANFFDPIHMFGVKSFDIVIANPPYIGETGNKGIFRQVKSSSLGKRFAQSKMDYFYYFFHLAIELATDSGVICFITTNYFPTATSASLLRREFRAETNVLKLINFNELKIFKSALGQHNLITLLAKGKPDPEFVVQTCVTGRKGDADSAVLNQILGWTDSESSYFEIPQSELYKGERLDIVLKGSRELDFVLDKLVKNGKALKSFTSVTQGIQTGANDVFVFDELPKELEADKPVTELFVKPLHKNSDIVRYGAKSSEKKLLYIPTGLNIEKYPNLENYLTKHKDRLESRAQIVRSRQPWFQLLWPRDPKTFIARPKIVAPYRSRANAFFYTEDQFYGSTDTYFVLGEESLSLKSVLAFLNSSAGLVWFKNMGKVKGVMLDLTGDNLELFPVPIGFFNKEITTQFETLVDQIQTMVRDSDDHDDVLQSEDFREVYSQIDQLVFECYLLTPEEQSVLLEEAANLNQE
jgi:type I restriction-modification system DNA methylase subunit